MKDPKVGEKVAVYTASFGRTLHTITRVEPDRLSLTGLKATIPETAHPKQCRRLKPKPKLREIWIHEGNINPGSTVGAIVTDPKQIFSLSTDQWVRFREVREKK